MTAMQKNAELFRQLSIIAEDESLMAKTLKYAKKLAAKKYHEAHHRPVERHQEASFHGYRQA